MLVIARTTASIEVQRSTVAAAANALGLQAKQ